ncbi:MAG: 4Fe-4S dicluster domain-containing protein [Deltaproteobacteria bacterium]|jgi:ferredoxin|nr:4Fe-4S dicluster domain-containing protein [Deltaproteobacteria bacterium]
MSLNKKISLKIALPWLRRFLAYGFLALLLLAFLNPRPLSEVVAFLARFQFGQALAHLASGGDPKTIALVTVMALLTCFLGRWFCGFVCPLGALMDLVSRLKGLFGRRRFRYKPFTFKSVLIPLLTLIAFWFGASTFFGLLEPYSLLVSKSLVYAGPNLLLFGVIILAFWRGRSFCDFLCPTGLVLKILALASPFHLSVKANCLKCGACSRVCAAFCVDGQTQTLDRGRCLLCFDCLAVCPNGSLSWGRVSAPRALPVQSRRSFLSQAAFGVLAFGSWLAPETLRAKTLGQPDAAPILPPGALSLAHFGAHCSLCHGCVRLCPNQALVPSSVTHPALWDRPVLDPYQGFCQYDCVLCAQICPTGALRPLSVEEKHRTRLGQVTFERAECVIVKNGTSCGACAELCPTGAVRMTMTPLDREEPFIRDNLCVGCGACQQACPVRPISAIRVTGLLIHQTADLPVVIETEDETLTEDFPF